MVIVRGEHGTDCKKRRRSTGIQAIVRCCAAYRRGRFFWSVAIKTRETVLFAVCDPQNNEENIVTPLRNDNVGSRFSDFPARVGAATVRVEKFSGESVRPFASDLRRIVLNSVFWPQQQRSLRVDD